MKNKMSLLAAIIAIFLWAISGAIVLSCLLAMFGCHTSPEVAEIPVPVVAEPVEGEAELPPPVGDILFSAGDVAWYIFDFEWGKTYNVDLVNTLPYTCTGDFVWRVVYCGQYVASGGCCGFAVPPGESTVQVNIPWFNFYPPVCDEAVLTIRVY